MMNKNIQIKNEISNSFFQNACTLAKYEVAKTDVKESVGSGENIKNLTLDIMDVISKDYDIALMNKVANAVEAWKKDETRGWKESLSMFARTNPEIESVWAGKTDFGNQFLMVMDDSASDSILDYNGFGFKLCEKYKDINDFMILDTDEFGCMKEQFKLFKKIYQRG